MSPNKPLQLHFNLTHWTGRACMFPRQCDYSQQAGIPASHFQMRGDDSITVRQLILINFLAVFIIPEKRWLNPPPRLAGGTL